MKDWKKCLVTKDTPILKVLEIIDNSSMQIALVVDENERLLGTITDGDVRRAILKGCTLSESVNKIMNKKPIHARHTDKKECILAQMRQTGVSQIPVLDNDDRIVEIETVHELLQRSERDNWIVILAGGLGQRLHPLTIDCPKPLLNVGDRPILETIMQSFIEYGFHKFYFAVNYKAEMIEEYFADGAKWGVEIQYLREKCRLGTAGALSLLPEKPTQPVFVMNGDLLTKINFQQLLNFHTEHNACATMCVREYNIQVPYGVVELDKHKLVGIAEKPLKQFFVNAGVYVLEPEIIDMVPQDTFFDMPTLFETLIAKRFEIAVFPIREYWLDIGRIGDFEQANGEFFEVFK